MHPKLTSMVGYWRLSCVKYSDDDDGPSEYEKLWNSLRTIAEDGPSLFSKPPGQTSCRYAIYFECYTPDQTDVNGIRLAAEFIRSRVEYPYVMTYFDTSSLIAGDRNVLFQHTPEGELYEKLEHGFKLVVATDSLTRSNWLGEFDGLNISTGSDSPDNSHESNEDGDSNTHLPSEVFDKEYIFMPPMEEGNVEMWKAWKPEGGKWMVFSPGGFILDLHDAAWLALLPLWEKGILVGLKASTNVLNEAKLQNVPGGFKRTGPVIHCYTADSKNRDDVLKAAAAIREVYNNNCIMFYKPNSDYEKGYNTYEGKKIFSSYMHTVSGGFYARDQIKRCELILPKNKCGEEL